MGLKEEGIGGSHAVTSIYVVIKGFFFLFLSIYKRCLSILHNYISLHEENILLFPSR